MAVADGCQRPWRNLSSDCDELNEHAMANPEEHLVDVDQK